MHLRIRKEAFGYIVYDRDSRRQRVLATDVALDALQPSDLATLLSADFPGFDTAIHRHEFMFPPQNGLELAAPLGMYLEISPACNMKCEHCYKPVAGRTQPLAYSQLATLIEELHAIGVFELRFCGNEPTVSDHLPGLFRLAKELDFYVGINTNGFFGEREREELLSLNPDLVVVSLDGGEYTHDKIRRAGSYRAAVALLEFLSDRSVTHRINTVISMATIGELESVVRTASETNSGVSFIPLRTIGRSTCFKSDELIDALTMYQAVREINRLRAAYPQVSILTYFDILGHEEVPYHSMHFNSPCPARKNGFVAHDGEFVPCDFMRHQGERVRCGNVRDRGFYAIWKDSAILRGFQGLRHARCQSCEHYLKRCHGGCLAGHVGMESPGQDPLCFVDLVKIGLKS